MTLRMQHVLLHLDLATNNPIPVAQVRAALPPDVDLPTYRMTEFGAEQTETGSLERGWHHWAHALERMLAQVRSDLGSCDRPLHYHVTGRAGHPIAAYAGLALSGAADVTVHNARRKTRNFDSFDLIEPTGRPPQPFFTVNAVEPNKFAPTGMLAVFVGVGQPCPRDAIADFFRRQNAPFAGLAELNTFADDLVHLDATNAPAALADISIRLKALHQEFPQSKGLVLFLACPFSLTVALGWAINPRAGKRTIWIPTYQDGAYQWGLHYPRDAPRNNKPKVLVLTASPKNEPAVDSNRELRRLRDALDPVHGRFELDLSIDFRPRDLVQRMQAVRPDIIHILCHGGPDGTTAATTEDDKRRAALIYLEELLPAFAEIDPPPRLIVFNACHSAVPARALAQTFDTTLGATEPLEQTTAAELTYEFYSALAQGHRVRAAFAQAKRLLGMHEITGHEHLDIYHAPFGDRGDWVPFPRA